MVNGGPAHRSREISVGDRLLAIDGTPVAPLQEEQVRRMLTGAPGSQVELMLGKAAGGHFFGSFQEERHKVVLTREFMDAGNPSRTSNVDPTSPAMSVSPQSSFSVRTPLMAGQAPGSLGLLLAQDTPQDGNFGTCFVKSLQPNGAAAMNGRLRIGDEVLSIDGFECDGHSLSQISSRIQRPAGTHITLVVSRFALQGGGRREEEEIELVCQATGRSPL